MRGAGELLALLSIVLPLFAYLSLSLAHAQTATPPRPADLRYREVEARHAPLLAAAAVDDEAAGIIDLKEAAFGVLDRNAPRLARYARGSVVMLPLVARTAVGDTAYGAAVSLRMP